MDRTSSEPKHKLFNPDRFPQSIDPQNPVEPPIKSYYFDQQSFYFLKEAEEKETLIFEFFLANNDILKKIDNTHENEILTAYKKREEVTDMALGVSFIPAIFSTFRFASWLRATSWKSRILFGTFFYLTIPFIGTNAVGIAYSPVKLLTKYADIYSFKREDYEDALSLFKQAEVEGCLDRLLKFRDEFDLRRLEEKQEL